MFIDLKPGAWTLIVSSWPPQTQHDPKNKRAIWGAFGYTPDKDIVRVPMKLKKLTFSMEELTWAFAHMTDNGGKFVLMWDKEMATVRFKVGRNIEYQMAAGMRPFIFTLSVIMES